MSKTLLEVSNLSMRFGGLLAVNGVALQLREKEIVSIIGPNGAGKTTVFNCLTGFYKPTNGVIRFRGEEIQGLPGHEIARKGIVRTFQHVRLFKEMTVLENLLVAQHRHMNTNFLAGLLKTPAFRRSEKEALEIARCMCTQPKILMLDEPAAGLNPKETEDLNNLIRQLRDQFDVSVLLIEHDMKLVMDISDHIFVVNQGTPLAEGKPAEVRDNPAVIKAYLGES
jgi:branched-chain amino acid transport system ATP-binding protein